MQHPEFIHYESDDPLFFIMRKNDELIGNPLDNINEGININNKDVEYVSKNRELEAQLIPEIERGYYEGLEPEEIYDTMNNSLIKNTFKKNYIIKLLGGLLGTLPIINNYD